jgi:catechol 2,3-dioxygenase-like lactoylglutathione lyase family enzyme
VSVTGYGDERPWFWVAEEDATRGKLHVAIQTAIREAVDAFHREALAAGGRDNGAPGPRPHYHSHYYGAFVLDPDGHNIEAVCHRPG